MGVDLVRAPVIHNRNLRVDKLEFRVARIGKYRVFNSTPARPPGPEDWFVRSREMISALCLTQKPSQ